jgi:hypothetical protein
MTIALTLAALTLALVPLARCATVYGVRPECDDFLCIKSKLVAFSFPADNAAEAKDLAVLIGAAETRQILASVAFGAASAPGAYEVLLYDDTVGHAAIVTVDTAGGAIASRVEVAALQTPFDTAVRTAHAWCVTSGPTTATVSTDGSTVTAHAPLWPQSATHYANPAIATGNAAAGMDYSVIVDAKDAQMNIVSWNVTAGTVKTSPPAPYGTSSFDAVSPVSLGWDATSGAIVALGQTVGGLVLATVNPATYNATEIWNFESFVGHSAGPDPTANIAAGGVYYMTLVAGGGGSGESTLSWLGVDLTTRKLATLTSFKFPNTPKLRAFAIVV